jgi:hypothetical protein
MRGADWHGRAGRLILAGAGRESGRRELSPLSEYFKSGPTVSNSSVPVTGNRQHGKSYPKRLKLIVLWLDMIMVSLRI